MGEACAEEGPDDRDSTPPDEGERPSSVAIIAACVICEQEPQHRRGLGRRCYRKWLAMGWPLPPRHPPGRRPGDAIQQVVDRMAPTARLVWIRALLGPETIALLVTPRPKR